MRLLWPLRLPFNRLAGNTRRRYARPVGGNVERLGGNWTIFDEIMSGHWPRCPACWVALDVEDDWSEGEYHCISCDWHGPINDMEGMA